MLIHLLSKYVSPESRLTRMTGELPVRRNVHLYRDSSRLFGRSYHRQPIMHPDFMAFCLQLIGLSAIYKKKLWIGLVRPIQ
jgi:hypothetical protein